MANHLCIIGVESGGINLKAEVIKALGSRLKNPAFFLDQTDFSANHWIMKRNTHHQRVVLFGCCDRGHDRNPNSRLDSPSMVVTCCVSNMLSGSCRLPAMA